VSRGAGPVNITHYNVARTYDVQANVSGSDLGTVATAVDAALKKLASHVPKGTKVTVQGQAASMESSFRGLGYGLAFAVLLVYLLLVVNFQSWLDPLVILMALPGALAGIAWILFLTGTTVSVPALMGAMMCIGVATSNSVLVITFANDRRALGHDAHQAAVAAGMTRLRPVIMTALAMIIGMLPMSLGLGEGGEQNAPLGRAVIGGLLLATWTTLFFVPVMYSVLRQKPPQRDPAHDMLEEA
jgi:multidrug efflux pump subunit AcrB